MEEVAMGKKRKRYQRYPVGLKQQAVGRMRLGENVAALARELKVDRSTLYVWLREAEGRPYRAEAAQEDPRERRIRELEAKVAGLEGALGRKDLELDFFGQALRAVEELRRKKSGSGGTASTNSSAPAPERKAD